MTDREREREGQDKKRQSDEQAFVEKKIWQKKRNRVDGTSRRRAKKRDNEEKGCFVSLISDIHLSFLSLSVCVCVLSDSIITPLPLMHSAPMLSFQCRPVVYLYTEVSETAGGIGGGGVGWFDPAHHVKSARWN